MKKEDIYKQQDFLFKSPDWMMKWGITMIFVVSIILFLLAYLIQYPDRIQSRVVILEKNPPTPVITKKSGKLISFLVDNQQEVIEGDIIGIIEHFGVYNDIIELDSILNQIGANWAKYKLAPHLNLGTVQHSYTAFVKALNTSNYHDNSNLYQAEITVLKEQISELEALNLSLDHKRELLEKQLSIADKKVRRAEDLQRKGSYSLEDLENAQENYLNTKTLLANSTEAKLQYQLQIKKIEERIISLRNQYLLLTNDYANDIELHFNNLRSELNEWKAQHLLKAPITGRVQIHKHIELQHFYEANTIICTIASHKASSLEAIGIIPYANLGKVQVGHQVNIKLDPFPFREFGVLKSKIVSIAASPIPQKGYEFKSNIPLPLTTSYDKGIDYKQNMTGTAEIITEKRSILIRLMERLKSPLKNY